MQTIALLLFKPRRIKKNRKRKKRKWGERNTVGVVWLI